MLKRIANFFAAIIPAPKYDRVRENDVREMFRMDNSIRIIDVRTAAEYRSGHIKPSKNLHIGSSDFLRNIQNLDREKTYVMVCRTGSRSGMAARIMARQGFENLYNLSGGIMGWNGDWHLRHLK